MFFILKHSFWIFLGQNYDDVAISDIKLNWSNSFTKKGLFFFSTFTNTNKQFFAHISLLIDELTDFRHVKHLIPMLVVGIFTVIFDFISYCQCAIFFYNYLMIFAQFVPPALANL